MRVRSELGDLKCSCCQAEWINYPKDGPQDVDHVRLCDNCLTPSNYFSLFEDIAWMQSGVLSGIGITPAKKRSDRRSEILCQGGYASGCPSHKLERRLQVATFGFKDFSRRR